MTVIDLELLAEFRRARFCGLCGKPTPQGTVGHHHIRRGIGGGSRLDIRWNLLAICWS